MKRPKVQTDWNGVLTKESYSKEEVVQLLVEAETKAVTQHNEFIIQVIRSLPKVRSRKKKQGLIEDPGPIKEALNVFQDNTVSQNADYIMQILLQEKFLDDEESEIILGILKETGKREILDVISELKKVSKFEIYSVIAKQFGMETSKSIKGYLDSHGGELTIPTSVLPAEVARRYHTVSLGHSGKLLKVAIFDPLDIEIIDALKYIMRMEIEAVVVPREQIDEMLDKMYPQLTSEQIMECVKKDMGETDGDRGSPSGRLPVCDQGFPRSLSNAPAVLLRRGMTDGKPPKV